FHTAGSGKCSHTAPIGCGSSSYTTAIRAFCGYCAMFSKVFAGASGRPGSLCCTAGCARYGGAGGAVDGCGMQVVCSNWFGVQNCGGGRTPGSQTVALAVGTPLTPPSYSMLPSSWSVRRAGNVGRTGG